MVRNTKYVARFGEYEATMTGLGEWSGKALTAFAALCLFANASVRAQTAQELAPITQAQESPEDFGQICISIALFHGTITVGRGVRRIEIKLVGGACEPPGSRISSLWANYPSSDGFGDVVNADDCPAYREKVNELWSAKSHHARPRRAPAEVQAGRFAIQDSDDLFELETNKGRQAAAQWIRETLAAVRPCWNTIRQDQTLYVVEDLYGRLSMQLPSAPELPKGSGSAPQRD